MKLLALDGGGVRGIVSAVWLGEILRHLKTGATLHDTFDLIAGTSTGSILAIGTAAGMTPEHMVDMYLTKAQDAFTTSRTKRIWSRLNRLLEGKGFSVPKFDDEGLNLLLKETLGEDLRFGNLNTKVLVPTYDVEHTQPRVFKNWRREYEDIPAWEVARASSAAPTFLPAHRLNMLGRDHYLVDGGLVANNPSMCALAEALRLGAKKEDIVLVSLGTGQSAHSHDGTEVQHWGAIQWAPNIITALMDGSSDVSTYHTKMILGDKCFRFQMIIPKELASMDNSNPDNLRKLARLARRHMGRAEMKDQLRHLISLLEEKNGRNT